jgi:G3E family GTPase
MTEDHATDPMNVGESLRYVIIIHLLLSKKNHTQMRQIAGSDVVILNKTDLATPATLAHTESLIRQVNPVAPIHQTVKGVIDLKHIIGISAYSKPPQSGATNLSLTPHGHDCDGTHDHDSKTRTNHYEFRGISSLRVECPPLSAQVFDKFDQWIRTVLWENHLPEEDSSQNRGLLVLRCKGMLTTASGKRHVLQGVRNLYEIEEIEETNDDLGIPDEGKVILIGKGLDDVVRHSLEAVLNS